jgi:hypothetical protein
VATAEQRGHCGVPTDAPVARRSFAGPAARPWEQRALRREAIAHHVEEGAHPCSALEIGMIGIVGLKLQAG